MLDINKQAMKYSLQGQTVTIYKRDDEGNILYEGYTDTEGNFILILMMREIRYPKSLKKKQVFQSRLISKPTYHSAVEKHRAKNTALIPLILTLFY